MKDGLKLSLLLGASGLVACVLLLHFLGVGRSRPPSSKEVVHVAQPPKAAAPAEKPASQADSARRPKSPATRNREKAAPPPGTTAPQPQAKPESRLASTPDAPAAVVPEPSIELSSAFIPPANPSPPDTAKTPELPLQSPPVVPQAAKLTRPPSSGGTRQSLPASDDNDPPASGGWGQRTTAKPPAAEQPLTVSRGARISEEIPMIADGGATTADDSLPLETSFDNPRTGSVSTIVAQRALAHIDYGSSLARRGANFAARQEFIKALSLVAEAHDASAGTRAHTGALASALLALDEADDYLPESSEQQLNLNVPAIAASHQSQILTPQQAKLTTPTQAMQAYYAFAQGRLALAGKGHGVASRGLYCLGKLLCVAAQFDATGRPIDETKAIVMFHASLQCDPNNYQSANELAVLLARHGQMNQARELLLHSLRVHPMPAAWVNLATVHQAMGQNDLAQMAMNEYRNLANADPQSVSKALRWVDSGQFGQAGAGNRQVSWEQAGQPPAEAPSKNWLQSIVDWF